MKNMGRRKWVVHAMAFLTSATVGITTPAMGMLVQAVENVAVEKTGSGVTTEKTAEGYKLSNEYFIVETGKYGNINRLQIKDDRFPTNYVMNPSNAAAQAEAVGHQWMGELMFKVKSGNAANWSEQNTGRSDSGRKIELMDNQVVVTYENATEEKGIKDFKVVETYSLEADGKLRWEITVTNTKDQDLIIGDFGVPLAFNEYWPGGEEIYETRTVDHSFVGKDSSYVYVTRPSGLGQFLVMTPDVSTGAGFEYQDHWHSEERAADEQSWCTGMSGWANGLNVFYIHSDVIKSTNRGYLGSTSLTLPAGESKTYAFHFSVAQDEKDLKSILYREKILDAVAVPGMAYAIDMPGKLYLHTDISKDDISFEIKCPHEADFHKGSNTVKNLLDCKKTADGSYVKYVETKTIDGEQYHIYDIKFEDLGQNNVIVNYGEGKQTVLQFYMMDDVADALETHSDFMVEKTQIHTPGKTGDKVFDDWMMDTKTVRAETDPTYWEKDYWGWGDDWGLTHGTYLAEKNVYQPVAKEIEAVDQYLDVAVWNDLMREHHKDYMVHDFLMIAPNMSPTYRGYAYPHIYNTYFSMYKIAKKYPDMVDYIEDKDTYLLRACNILKALYGDGVAYNWETGLMGELTTPAIIAALREEGYYAEADDIASIMVDKYKIFKDTKYPYGSEYSYDNTGEEAVYTLARLNLATDARNASSMMNKIDAKTRACRGVQPVWYHYANPTTICGENWWNFQYTAALAGYCMDDWLRLQKNGLNATEKAESSRLNYAAKLANLTCINSGQIDADSDNIGAVAWTYQSEMGNFVHGTADGGGKLHNGWRNMAGESDLGLFGALQILSSDVAVDPVFGLFGYGCNVSEDGGKYTVIPLDGLYTKLNFINQEFYIELRRDQYTQAVVGTDNTSVELTMKNIEKTAHDTDIDFTGLAAGSYQVKVNNAIAGSFRAVEGKTSTVTVSLPEAETVTVKVEKGEALANQAPTVNAGEDQTVAVSDSVRLVGKVTDDGYVNADLTYTWEEVNAKTDAEATIKNVDKLISDVSFPETGIYTFKLTANDGALETSDTVTYTVTENAAKPEVMALYNFEEASISADKRYVMTEAGKEYYGTLTYNPVFTDSKAENGKALKMTGKISGGYLELPHTLTELVTNATIAADVYLSVEQANHTTVFRLGKDCVVELVSGNELSMTVNGNTINTHVKLAPEYWKNIALTADGDDYVLYIDGIMAGELKDTGLELKDIADTERYFIGRPDSETGAFLNAAVDNVTVKSVTMTADQVKAVFGSEEEAVIIAGKEPVVVTPVGMAPVLPKMIDAFYSDGVYKQNKVIWEAVSQDKYKEAGSFTVCGKFEGTEILVTAKVQVVAGTIQNIAGDAKPTAIFEDPKDLGGVAVINDGNEPANSADTSNGAWHNGYGNQSGPAWVRYDWDEPQVISKMDIYFFKNGNGYFIPDSYTIEYLTEDDTWHDVTEVQGLGVEPDQYNTTTFAPVFTKALRINMNPASIGCGILEWKVYGYKDGVAIDYSALKSALMVAESLNQKLFTAGAEKLASAIDAAKSMLVDKGVTQGEVNIAAQKLNLTLLKMTPNVKDNIAYVARTSTSYVSAWEQLSAVNDGIVYDNNSFAEKPHYGTWGNESSGESVTYTWGLPVTIGSSDVYFWTDGGGIEVPSSYLYEYLDSNGTWRAVSNAKGYKILDVREDAPGAGETLNGFNTTTFDAVTTTAFRITINKAGVNGNGIGLIEWRVFGAPVMGVEEDIAADEALKAAISLVPEKAPEEYTTETYQAYANALSYAKLLESNPQATAEQKKNAAETLKNAYAALTLFEPITALAKVSSVKAECAGSASVKISWKQVKRAERYEVYRQNGKKWKKVATVADTTFMDKKLLSNKTYTYRVRAAASGICGNYSKSVKGTTGPAKVKSLKLKKASKTSYTFTWKKVSKATGYEIYQKTGKGRYKKIKTLKSKQLKYTVRSLKKGESYRFYVKAVRKFGNKTYGSTPVYTNTVKIK